MISLISQEKAFESEDKRQSDAEADLSLDADQRKEYDRLKEEVGKRASLQSQQLQILERYSRASCVIAILFTVFSFRQQSVDDNSLKMMKSQVQQLEDRKTEVQQSREQLSTKVDKIRAELGSVQERKAGLVKERTGASLSPRVPSCHCVMAHLVDLIRSNEGAKVLQQSLSDALKEIHHSLSEAKSDIEVMLILCLFESFHFADVLVCSMTIGVGARKKLSLR